MTTGEKIKDLRKAKGLTQQEFADSIMVSRRSVMDWEHDRYSPQTENLKEICRVYSLELNYFLLDDNEGLNNELSKAFDKAIVDNDKSLKIEEFEALKGSVMITAEDKNTYRRKILAKNKIYPLYKPLLYLAIISPFIIIIATAFNESVFDKIWYLAYILPIVLYIIYRYFKKRYIDSIINALDNEVKNIEGLIDIDYPLAIVDSDNRFKVYSNNTLYIDVLANEIKKISLYLNNQMFLGLLPKVADKVYFVQMEIYYSDGNKSVVSVGWPLDDKIIGSINYMSKLRIIDRFNRIYVKYDQK